MLEALLEILKKFDLTEIFKTKGKLKRWSIKRTTTGAVITMALNDVAINGITNQNLGLCFIGLLPLLLSFFERN
jgi:hypothetical protein|tara:strand:- start:2085 stop:2306 length:222 start_codon:yes stop_codon:yes gene_type:complete